MERNILTVEDAKMRIGAQMKTKDKLKLADFTVNNSYTLNETKEQVERLYKVFDKSKKYIKIRICIGIALSMLLGGIVFTANLIYKKTF
jgi:ferritin-like metal-binding protein YciE